MFDRILETDQNSDILLKAINKYVPLSSINENDKYSRSKLSNRSEIVSPGRQLQWKRQKNVREYSQKLIDDFKLIVVHPLSKLTDQEKHSIATYFGYSSQDQGIENNAKRILTLVLESWNENKSSAHPNTHAFTFA